MLSRLFGRSPQNVDDLRKIRDKAALEVVQNHLDQVAEETKQDFRQRFKSRNDQLQALGQRTLYLQRHGDNMVACDNTGTIQGIVEGPLATMEARPGHQDQFTAPTNHGNSYVLGQQVSDINPLHPEASSTGIPRNEDDDGLIEEVARDIDSSRIPELHPVLSFPSRGTNGRPSTMQLPPSGHLTLPSPPPSGEPSLYPGSRSASRNDDTTSLSSFHQAQPTDEIPQTLLLPTQRVRIGSAPPSVPTSGGLSPLQLFSPPQPAMTFSRQIAPSALNLQSGLGPSPRNQNQQGTEADTPFVHPMPREDAATRSRALGHPHGLLSSTHLSLDRPFPSPFPGTVPVDNYEEMAQEFLEKLDSMGASTSQPQQSTRPVEDSKNSTMEAMRSWGMTMCEILKEQIARWNQETEVRLPWSLCASILMSWTVLTLSFNGNVKPNDEL